MPTFRAQSADDSRHRMHRMSENYPRRLQRAPLRFLLLAQLCSCLCVAAPVLGQSTAKENQPTPQTDPHLQTDTIDAERSNESDANEYDTSDPDTGQSDTGEPDTVEPGLFGLRRAVLDGPLVTDRPDFTESTDAVPWGHLQIEAGYTFTYDREGSDRLREHTVPELLLRVGIVEDFELRFGWTGYSYTQLNFKGETRGGRTVSREERSQGSNDFEVGFKLKIAEQDGISPHLAILGGVTFPTGSDNVTSGDVEPLLGLLWAYDLTDRAALAGQFIFALPVDEGDRFFQTAASLSLAYSLTERLGTYVEYFGFYHNTEHSDCAHSINGGFTYLLSDNFQIDIRAGFGLNEEADDFFTGAGFAWRF